MSFPGLLNSRVNFKRETLGTPDLMGGYGPSTWNVTHLNVPCCFEALSRKDDQSMRAHDKTMIYPDQYIYLVWRSGIKEGDRAVGPDNSAREFEIKLVERVMEQTNKMKLTVVEIGREQ